MELTNCVPGSTDEGTRTASYTGWGDEGSQRQILKPGSRSTREKCSSEFY